MKYEVLVFDMDGTILNTLEDLWNCTNYALRAHQMPERTLEEVRHFVGNGIQKLVERATPDGATAEEVASVLSTFKSYYKDHCADTTRPYEGITEVIREARQRGYRTAVVTNKADFAAQELAEEYFPGLFDLVVGEKAGIKKKPAPDTVEQVLHTLGIEKKKAVYIGDSDVDCQTAHNAKVDLIAVKWGFREEEVLIENGAKTIVSTPQEILTWI